MTRSRISTCSGVSGKSQVAKTAAVRNGNTRGQDEAHEGTEVQELYGYQQSSGGRTEANEQRRAATKLQSTAKTSP